jgi:hypothetical protein
MKSFITRYTSIDTFTCFLIIFNNR